MLESRNIIHACLINPQQHCYKKRKHIRFLMVKHMHYFKFIVWWLVGKAKHATHYLYAAWKSVSRARLHCVLYVCQSVSENEWMNEQANEWMNVFVCILYIKLFAHYSWILSGFDTNWKPKMGHEISESHLFAQLHYLNGLGLYTIDYDPKYGALIWKKVGLGYL